MTSVTGKVENYENHIALQTNHSRVETGMLLSSRPVVYDRQNSRAHESTLRTKLNEYCLNHEKVEQIGKLFFALQIFTCIGMFVLGGKSSIDCAALGQCRTYSEPKQSECIAKLTPICNYEMNGFIATIVALVVFTLIGLFAWVRADKLHKSNFPRLNEV